NFQVILIEIAKYIERGNLDWSGKELAQTEEILEEAIRLVELDKENHFYRDQHSYYNYFIMREGQFELLENMLSLATRIPKKDKEKELPQTQEEFESRASLFQLMNELEAYLRLKNRFKKTDLKKMNKNKKIKTDII